MFCFSSKVANSLHHDGSFNEDGLLQKSRLFRFLHHFLKSNFAYHQKDPKCGLDGVEHRKWVNLAITTCGLWF